MKYIALIHHNPAAWEALSQAERDAFNSDAELFLEAVTKSGALVGGAVVLAHPSNAKTMRVRDGAPAVTDGPFAESKEVLAGYYVLDCESSRHTSSGRSSAATAGSTSARTQSRRRWSPPRFSGPSKASPTAG